MAESVSDAQVGLVDGGEQDEVRAQGRHLFQVGLPDAPDLGDPVGIGAEERGEAALGVGRIGGGADRDDPEGDDVGDGAVGVEHDHPLGVDGDVDGAAEKVGHLPGGGWRSLALCLATTSAGGEHAGGGQAGEKLTPGGIVPNGIVPGGRRRAGAQVGGHRFPPGRASRGLEWVELKTIAGDRGRAFRAWVRVVSVATGTGAQEFLAGDWDGAAQLVGGEVVMTDPRLWHQELVARLLEALRTWCRTPAGRGVAGIGGNWVLGAGEVYKPDVWWVADPDRLDLHAAGNAGAPDIAVEVRSPSTWHLDIGPKRSVYEAAGLAELWLVDSPATAVLISRRSKPKAATFNLSAEVGPGDVVSSPLLEGFALAVDELFA